MRDSGADPRLCGTQSDRAAQGSDLRSSALRPLPGQEREAECETPSRAQPLRAADHHDPLQQGPFLRAFGRGQEQGASPRVGSLGPGGYPARWLRGADTSSGGSGRASHPVPGALLALFPRRGPDERRAGSGLLESRRAGLGPRGPALAAGCSPPGKGHSCWAGPSPVSGAGPPSRGPGTSPSRALRAAAGTARSLAPPSGRVPPGAKLGGCVASLDSHCSRRGMPRSVRFPDPRHPRRNGTRSGPSSYQNLGAASSETETKPERASLGCFLRRLGVFFL